MLMLEPQVVLDFRCCFRVHGVFHGVLCLSLRLESNLIGPPGPPHDSHVRPRCTGWPRTPRGMYSTREQTLGWVGSRHRFRIQFGFVRPSRSDLLYVPFDLSSQDLPRSWPNHTAPRRLECTRSPPVKSIEDSEGV